jgi:hypothetical protein
MCTTVCLSAICFAPEDFARHRDSICVRHPVQPRFSRHPHDSFRPRCPRGPGICGPGALATAARYFGAPKRPTHQRPSDGRGGPLRRSALAESAPTPVTRRCLAAGLFLLRISAGEIGDMVDVLEAWERANNGK